MSSQTLFEQANAMWDAGRNKQAFEILKKAADMGDIFSFNSIGYFYDQGIGVKKDSLKAILWYKKAARHNDICAFSNLGIVYRDKGNLKRARFWFERAIQNGDAEAALELAKELIKRRTSRGRTDAVRYLRLAVKLKNLTDEGKKEAIELLKQYGP